MLSAEQTNTIVNTLQSVLSPSLVYVFGSHSKGTDRPDSDIDIAYVSDQKLTSYERFMLAQQLATLLNKDVDLIDLTQASTVFQMQIVSRGVVIHCTDSHLRQAYTLRVYKMYTRLNEERADILKKLAQGGL